MNKRMLLGCLTIIIEVSYLYPLYYLAAFAGQTPPQSILGFAAILAISLAVVTINFMLSQKKLRLITVVITNILMLFFIESYFTKTHFFPEHKMIYVLAQMPTTDLQGIFQNLTLSCFILWVWLRSIIHSRKGVDYPSAVNRFELSMALLFLVLLGIEIINIRLPQISGYLFLCIIANFACLSLTNSGTKATPWLGFGYAVFLLVPWSIGLNYLKTGMYSSSNALFNLFYPVAVFFKDLLAVIFTFLLQRGNYIPRTGETSYGQIENNGEGGYLDTPLGDSIFLEKIMWVLSIVILIAFFIIAFMILQRLFNKLMKRQKPIDIKEKKPWSQILMRMIMTLKTGLLKLYLVIIHFLPCKYSVPKAYHALLVWGRYKNQPRQSWETPSEYYQRLAALFPKNKLHFKKITDYYLQFSYGYKAISSEGINELKDAVSGIYLPIMQKRKG